MDSFSEIHEIAPLVEAGEISPVELTSLMLERIERYDGQLQSYSSVRAEAAMKEAEQAESEIRGGGYRGPLHGIPLALKDLYWMKGSPTTAGTLVLQDFVPTEDATVVKRLRNAGAIILGQLRMTEGAFHAHHPALPTPLNPWNPEFWVGASSSGNGSATSAGLCFGSLGSDTGGSIRLPATVTGLTGLRPTWGTVSRYGELELAGSMDQIGPMARSAYDCGVILGAIAGEDENDPTMLTNEVPDYIAALERGLPPLRIGIDREFLDSFDERIVDMIDNAVKVFRDLGATIVETSMPDVSDAVKDWPAACYIEAAVAYESTFPSRRDEYSVEVGEYLDFGRAQSAMDFQKVLVRRRNFAGMFQRQFRDIDVLLMPSIGIPSPTVEEMNNLGAGDKWLNSIMRVTAPINMAGNPTIALPGAMSEFNTPMGYQIVGPHRSEALLLQTANAFQQVTNYHRRHPNMVPFGD